MNHFPYIAQLVEFHVVYSNIKRSFNHIIIDEQYGIRTDKSTITSGVEFTHPSYPTYLYNMEVKLM